MTTLVRSTATLCMPVVGGSGVGPCWQPGPLPIELPDGRVADAALRSTYFQPLAADALYGSQDRPARWNRLPPGGMNLGASTELLGLELLQVPQWGVAADRQRYLALLHVCLPNDDPVASLGTLVRIDARTPGEAGARPVVDELLGDGLQVEPSFRRATSLTFLAAKGSLPDVAEAPAGWSALETWLWLAASGTPFADYPPDPADPDLLAGMLYLSRTWRGLALRDGVAFVGVSRSEREHSFLASAEVYARTIYSDVLLLSMLQRLGLDAFAGELSRIGNRFEKSQEFRRLVNAVTEYRNVLWWDDVTQHGVANDLLRRLHTARRTPELFQRVVADLGSFQDQVESQTAERLYEAQQDEEARAQRFERFAAVASIAFALPLLILTTMLLPITGVTAGGREYDWWLIALIVIVTGGLGAGIGLAAEMFSGRRKRSSGGEVDRARSA